jgi:hypothetical protein
VAQVDQHEIPLVRSAQVGYLEMSHLAQQHLFQVRLAQVRHLGILHLDHHELAQVNYRERPQVCVWTLCNGELVQ